MKEELKDLCMLIRKSTIHYNETCEQGDVILSEIFKKMFGDYLRDNNYTVDFYKYTSVILTPLGNRMFVPNQWFVIAAYAVGVYNELIKYKQNLIEVCSNMGEKYKLIIPIMRNNPVSVDKNRFFNSCKVIFYKFDNEKKDLFSKRLWRFATDYSWWSGNKTIDRGDFHVSVILNMLSLVAVSQTFVAEIVSDYCKSGLYNMVSDLSNFTETASGITYLDDEYKNVQYFHEQKSNYEIDNNEQYANTSFLISVRTKK